MAEAVARVSGTPGVAAVTLGPGVTNTVTAALVSKMAGTPVLILGGQAKTASFDRGAGMSADHIPIMAPVTKWAARVLQTERIPEYLEAAWRIMWAGRPGPVFLEIPVDVLAAPTSPASRVEFARQHPGLEEAARDKLASALAGVRRPMIVLGDDVHWDRPAELAAAIEHLGWPFFTARLARGAVDERHALWAGVGYVPANETLKRSLSEADLVLVLGHHFEFDLGFGDGVAADAVIVQSSEDAALLGKNRRPDVKLLASPSSVVSYLRSVETGRADSEWIENVLSGWRAERERQLDADGWAEPLHPVAAVDAVLEAMPADTIYVSSHGNVDFWADARLQMPAPDQYLRAGQAGALGAEIPYGVGAKFARPAQPVVVFVGDGGAGYHFSELDTAARYACPVVVVVLDDEKWGAIALPQRDSYGGEFEMDLPRRNWPEMAGAMGGFGALARTGPEIGEAMRAAVASGKPAVVQVPVRSVISPVHGGDLGLRRIRLCKSGAATNVRPSFPTGILAASKSRTSCLSRAATIRCKFRTRLREVAVNSTTMTPGSRSFTS